MNEIRDDNLFRQPDESHLGECPLCCLSLPLDESKFGVYSCCSKRICYGCVHANQKREIEEGLEQKCPYCREPLPESDKEAEKNLMERVKANDPIAIFKMGRKREEGGDLEGAIQYWMKAAALGNMMAHYNLSILYHEGHGVEKDKKKEIHHLEEAAIGGHPNARYNLGAYELNSGRHDRAMKHYIIAAKAGYDDALEVVKQGFLKGYVSKEDYATALRGHQAAVDETKSQQRDEGYEYFQQFQN
jgi:tetratricopeptide (TPR) repeat protein